jgi:PEP-CTERM motif
MEVGVKSDAWLKAISCAALLCGAGAAQAAPDCAAQAHQPSWAECASDFSLGASAASAVLDRPSQLQFDDDASAVASMDFTQLAVKPDRSPQRRAEAPSTVAAIPEPQTNLLMVAGLAAIGFMAMRRRRP